MQELPALGLRKGDNWEKKMLICSISANYRLWGWKILYFCSFGPASTAYVPPK